VCWPSVGAVADAVGCSRREVLRAYTALEGRGLLTRTTDTGGRSVIALCLTPYALKHPAFGGDVMSQGVTSRHGGVTSRHRGGDLTSQGGDLTSPLIKEELINEQTKELISEPGATHPTDWLGVILPEGVRHNAEDDDAARKLAEHIRERYPSTLKPHHRQPVTTITRAMAPSLVTMAETDGGIAAACDRARRAVDALAAHIAANPDRAPFLPRLDKWLSGGGLEYENPCEYLPHLKPAQKPSALPYGAAEAPDESRVAEILERIRTNRSGPVGQSRRIAQ
jgi:hypothetical protein